MQIEDTTPPAVPVGLKGEVDKNGKVTLTWDANTDADLIGYRVFQSNSPREEFMEVTKSILSQPAFTDSININILDKKVYYSIVAVDKNYNPSEYTPYIGLNRPDVTPPVAPVFTQAEIKDGKVVLAWENGRNDDAAKLELTRIEKDDRTHRGIISWSSPTFDTAYTEPFLTQGKTYRYKLTVTDSAGNSSETLSREIFYETGVRSPVKEMQISVTREKKEIVLKWKNDSPALKCFIYRRKNDAALTLYQTIEGNIESFTDKAITANNTYGYKVQLVFAKGVKSLISDEIATDY